MPKGLDVMAALGSDLAVSELSDELYRWRYIENLDAMRQLVREQPREFWDSSIYNGWLNALRLLNEDLAKQKQVPRTFQTAAWKQKQLQTQLSSWSELRHDTILYAKQSYTTLCCEVPAAYVEPYPAFYAQLAKLAEAASESLKWVPSRNISTRLPLKAEHRSYSAFFKRMASHLRILEGIATKQLANEQLSRTEDDFLQTTASELGKVFVGSSFVRGLEGYGGWYPELTYRLPDDKEKWQATIADVHTDPNSGKVLEVGVGHVNYCVAQLDICGTPTIFVGPAYSYYEFEHPANDRLTDARWQSWIRRSKQPTRPHFVRALIGSDESSMEPPVRSRRNGDHLEIFVDDRSKRSGVPGSYSIAFSTDGLKKLSEVAPGLRGFDGSNVFVSGAGSQMGLNIPRLEVLESFECGYE